MEEEKKEASPEIAPVEPEKTPEPATAAPAPRISMFADNRKMLAAAGLICAAGLAYFGWTRLQPVLVAASVNGQTISRLEVIRELERQGGSSVLDGIISDRLLESKAAAENVTASASDVAGEVAIMKTQMESQGQTLDGYLTSQKMSMSYLEERLRLRLLLKRLLADKTTVTDAEIDEFIKQNKAAIPKGTDTAAPAFREEIRTQISDQKFSAAASGYVSGLRAAADIRYVHAY